MGWDKVKAELEGLSEAQLKLILKMAWRSLPEEQKELLVRLVAQMRHVNDEDKKG
ncbi:hypothetical protein ES708_20807 [subsurface metagenome]|jgi:hypothetical protein